MCIFLLVGILILILNVAFCSDDNYVLLFLCHSVEYNVSYVYHALFAYFDRDNIALKGLAK